MRVLRSGIACCGMVLALAGCALTPPVSEAQLAPITAEQSAAILAQNLQRLSGATPLDVDRYQPAVAVAGCPSARLQLTPPASEVADALKPASAYHAEKGGIGLAVWHDGALILEEYAQGAGRDTRTESFSMHKSLLALAIGVAIQDGVLPDKDVPIGRHLPEWAGDARGDIPLSALLNMESGLELNSMSGAGSQDAMALVMSGDITSVAMEHERIEAPNTTFRYNNANSQIAGTVLARALKQAGQAGYPAFLSEKIWCPLGNDDGAIWFDREDGAPHYFAGMQATLQDWLRTGILIANSGKVDGKQIVPADWIAAMATPAPHNPNYGMQVWLGSPADGLRSYSPESALKVPHSQPYLADDVIFFDGFGGQRVYIVPSRRIVVARTAMVDFSYDDSIILNAVLRAIPDAR